MIKKIFFVAAIVALLGSGLYFLTNADKAEAKTVNGRKSEELFICIEYKPSCDAEWSAPECCAKMGSYNAYY